MPALLGRVTDVQPHPANDTLRTKCDVVAIAGKTNVANRPAPEQPRYAVGDYAVVLTENLLLPDWLLRHLDLWDEVKSKGVLAGSRGNRTKARRIAGVASEVALCKIDYEISAPIPISTAEDYVKYHIRVGLTDAAIQGVSQFFVRVAKPADAISLEGIDVTWLLGIETYVPPAADPSAPQ